MKVLQLLRLNATPRCPTGELTRETPAGKLREAGATPSKRLRHFDFLGIRQSTANCSTHLPKKIQCINNPRSMELLQENSNNSCTDCLWKQRELRMTKEDLKYLQSQSHQKSNGKQFLNTNRLELGKYLPILSDKFLKNSLLVQKEVVLKDKSKNPNFNVEFEDKLVVLDPKQHAKFYLNVLFGKPQKLRIGKFECL